MYSLTGDMIAHQLRMPLLVFLLRHRDKMSFADILGAPFSAQSKEFQAEYLRISMIYQVVKRNAVPSILQEEAEGDD